MQTGPRMGRTAHEPHIGTVSGAVTRPPNGGIVTWGRARIGIVAPQHTSHKQEAAFTRARATP